MAGMHGRRLPWSFESSSLFFLSHSPSPSWPPPIYPLILFALLVKSQKNPDSLSLPLSRIRVDLLGYLSRLCEAVTWLSNAGTDGGNSSKSSAFSSSSLARIAFDPSKWWAMLPMILCDAVFPFSYGASSRWLGYGFRFRGWWAMFMGFRIRFFFRNIFSSASDFSTARKFPMIGSGSWFFLLLVVVLFCWKSGYGWFSIFLLGFSCP